MCVNEQKTHIVHCNIWTLKSYCIIVGNGVQQGPRWERHDDRLLLSADPSELQNKFGEEGVAKRMAFLYVE